MAKMASHKLSMQAYLRQGNARRLPVYECLINKGYETGSLATIIVARKHVNGNITFGVYLADLACLGVKDTLVKFNIDDREYRETVDGLYETGGLQTTTYAIAHNLIYGAIAYAEEYGFKPHKDFELTKWVLAEDDEAVELIEFEFGIDGKPTLFSSPDNNYTKEAAQLAKTAGPGNYSLVLLDNDGNELEEYDEDDSHDTYAEEIEKKLNDNDNLYYITYEDIPFIEKMVRSENMSEEANTKVIEQALKESAPPDFMMHQHVDLLFREKHSEYYNDEAEWMSKLWPEASIITFEPLRSHYIQSDEEEDEVENAYYLVQDIKEDNNNSDVMNRLYALQLKYPHNPVFRNFLRSAYETAGETEKALESALQNYSLSPEYLFARTDYAMELIKQKDFDKIPPLFNNAITLAQLYPEREQFHATEITAFAFAMGAYYISKEMIAAGEVHLKCFARLRQKQLSTFNLLRNFLTITKLGIIERDNPGPLKKLINKITG